MPTSRDVVIGTSIDKSYLMSGGNGVQAPMAFAGFESGLSQESALVATQVAETEQVQSGQTTDDKPNPTLEPLSGGEDDFGAPWLSAFASQAPTAHQTLPGLDFTSSFGLHYQQPSALPDSKAYLAPDAANIYMWPSCQSPSAAFDTANPQVTAATSYSDHESFAPDTNNDVAEQSNLDLTWEGVSRRRDEMNFAGQEIGHGLHVQRRCSVDSTAPTLFDAGSPPMELESGHELPLLGSSDMQRSYSHSVATPNLSSSSTLAPSASPPARSIRKFAATRGSSASAPRCVTGSTVAPAPSIPAGSVPVPSALQERTWQTWAPWINSLPDDDLKALETRQLHPLRYSAGMTAAERALTDLANERMMAAKNFKRRQINNAAAARSRARKNEALDQARREADDQARLRDEAASEAESLRERLAAAQAALDAARAENDALMMELTRLRSSKL